MAKRSPRISDAFSLHNRRMTDAEIRDTARGVMRILLAKLEGDPTNIQSWLDLARSLGIRVIGFYGPRGEAIAYYDNSEYEKGRSFGPFPSPRLVYNLCAPLEWRIFLILHEVAHHVGAQWPGSAFPKAATERYADIRQTAQHRVACAVEELFYEAFFCSPRANLRMPATNDQELPSSTDQGEESDV